MQAELHRIITADGITYLINPNNAARWLLSSTPGNWGLPPTDYQRDRVYKGQGEIEMGYTLQTRRFTLEVGGQGCSRDELWQLRLNLLEAIRPNRNGQLTFVFRQPDFTEYAIVARAVSDPFVGNTPDEWFEWGYQGGIDFEAIDPVWYTPTQVVVSGSVPAQLELVFPITFDNDNIVFGDSDLIEECIINYTGTWRDYPIITVTGPASTIQLIHVEKAVSLVWTGTLLAGTTLTFNLRNGYNSQGFFEGWTITDSTGANQNQYLDFLSNLLDFAIWPGSELGNTGTNTIRLNALQTDSNTALSVAYNTRYIGI